MTAAFSCRRHRCPSRGALLLRFVAASSLAFTFSMSPSPVSAQERCTVFAEDVVVKEGEVRECHLRIVNGDLIVEPGGIVRGNVNVVLASAVIHGRVEGDLSVLGDAEISGRVDGDVFVTDDLILGPESRVGGTVSTVGVVDQADGARVGGEIQDLRRLQPNRSFTSPQALLRDRVERALRAVSLVILAALFAGLAAVVMPGVLINTGHAAGGTSSQRLLATVVGFGVMVLWLLMLIPVTIVTLSLGGIVMVAGLLAAVALGGVAIGTRLGGRIQPRRSIVFRSSAGTGLIAAIVAPLLFSNSLRLLCGGLFIALILQWWSIGAAVLSRFGTVGPAPRLGRVPQGPEPEVEVQQHTPLQRTPLQRTPLQRTPLESASMESGPMESEPMESLPLEPLEMDAYGFHANASELELEQITGLTPIYVALLHEGGVTSMEDLSCADPSLIVRLIAVPGVLPITRATAESWVAAANEGLAH